MNLESEIINKNNLKKQLKIYNLIIIQSTVKLGNKNRI